MKIAIIADIHANYEALRSFPESCDELWVVGDLVNFGPNHCSGDPENVSVFIYSETND